MDRRDFVRLSAVTIGANIVLPSVAESKANDVIAPTRDIFYTKEAPGRWSGKVATHLPTIEVSKADGKIVVKVVTAHEMNGYEHYIVKHVLLDKDYHFMDEKLFNPTVDKTAISTYTLENYSGALYALSMCNKHDLWLNSAIV
jgi:superoxide reductase